MQIRSRQVPGNAFRPRRRAVLLGLCLLAAILPPLPASAAYNWLDVRRHGAPGVIEAAVAAEGSPARGGHYVCDTSPNPAWIGLQIELSRRMLPGKPKATQLVAIIRDAKGRFVAGVATDAKHIWVRHGDAKPQADYALLFRDIPGLGAPMALFAGLELTARYEAKLEGEFDGSAILRLQPGYTEHQGLEPLKVGVSKQNLLVSLSEIDDTKGEARARLLWIDARERDGIMIAERLRLRVRDEKRPIDLSRVRHDAGKSVRKKWGAAALR